MTRDSYLQSLVINANGHIAVIDQLVGGQDSIVRLNNCFRHLAI